MISGINSTANSVLDASTKSSNMASGASDAQDRFLTLLVAQMNNQDPMNPMDNAQMTSQIAQINTVTGIQQLNETMQSMASQFSALQVLQGASMVGRSVLMQGNQLATSDGVSKGSFEISSPATNIRVDVLGPAGELVGSVDVGAKGAGRHSFEWDASQYAGDTSQLRFAVTATNGTTPVAATTLSQLRVVSAGAENGALTLGLENGSSVDYTQVRSIM